MVLVVGLAGRQGSGKSWVSTQLAKHYGFTRTSFGDAVRAEASRRGLQNTINVLQDLGEAIILDWGWERFCQTVLPHAGTATNIAVDGIRHVAAADTIRRQLSRATFRLVFLDVDEQIRRKRLADRDQAWDINLDHHSVERELPVLRERADFVVDASGDSAPSEIAKRLGLA